MRSRRSIIDIWPAYADLFSTLAVLGIFASFFISEKENRINKLNKEVELKQSAFEELQTRCTKINKYFELAELVLEEVKAEIDHLGINVIRTADSLVLSENFIYFDKNDWSKPIFREGKVGEEKFLNLLESLKRSIEKKNARGKLIVYIEGHTDSSQFKTTQYTNWNLSSERASTIVNWIKSKNIDMDIIPIGLADTRPAPFCNILENEENKMACNRRIEIKISPNYSEIERTIQVSNEENIYDIKDSESIRDYALPDTGLTDIYIYSDVFEQIDEGIIEENVEKIEFPNNPEDANTIDVYDIGLIPNNYEKKQINIKQVVDEKMADKNVGKYLEKLIKQLSEFDEYGIAYSLEEFVDMLEDQRANDNKYLAELKKVFQNLNKVKESDDKKTPLVDICLRDSKIEKGKEFVINNKELLNKIEKIYAVDPFTITAVLMIESDFCTITGDYRIFNVFLSQILFLYDIARDVYGEQIDERINKKITRKIESAIDNLVVFLKTCKQKGIDPLDILGSSAGAIGCPQFMPNSLKYAIDGDRNGEIDLFNLRDAVYSIANYLKNHGYETDRDKAILRYNADKEFLECINQYSKKLKEAIEQSDLK